MSNNLMKKLCISTCIYFYTCTCFYRNVKCTYQKKKTFTEMQTCNSIVELYAETVIN